MKKIIIGILTIICAAFTGVCVYNLHQDYLQEKEEWNEEARKTFGEAVDMEVEKLNRIPIRIISVDVPEVSTLGDPYKEYVQWTSQYGERSYFIPFHKFQNSYVANTDKRIMLSMLLEEHPIIADTLNWHWDSLLFHRDIAVQTRVRLAITDVLEHTDTFYSEKEIVADSLTSIYLGHRCEMELTGYVAYPRWWNTLTNRQAVLLLLPWVVCALLIVCYNPVKKRLRPQPIIVEKAIKEYVEVEKKAQTIDNPKDRVTEYELPDGTRFDTVRGELHGINGSTVPLSPQEILMLTAFVKNDSHQISMDEAMDMIWGPSGTPTKFHRLLQRLRNSLKEATSITVKNTGKGIYQLVSSNDADKRHNVDSSL